MTIPKVSVIMPAYNHEKFVGEAIESVLNQTYNNFEFIIINDGSSDNTDGVIRNYTDDRIRYHVQENQDAYNAINNGIRLAKGEFISILNSDDVYHVDRLNCLVNAIEKSDAIFLITNIRLIGEDSSFIDDPSHFWNSWFDKLLSVYDETGSLEETFFKGNLAATTSNLFFKRSVTDDMGMFRPYHYAHDYDYAIRALFKYRDKFLFLNDKKLLYYRIHSKNTITDASYAANEQRYFILLSILKDLYLNKDHTITIDNALNTLEELHEIAVRQIRDRDAFIEHKERVILEKQAVISNQETHIVNINTILQEKNQQLAERDQQLAERDQQLAEHDQQLAERDQQLAERDQQLAERDQQLAERDQQLVERERQLAELNQHLAYRERKLQEMYNSYSWRISAPIRHVADIVLPIINKFRNDDIPTGESEEAKPGLTAYHVKLLQPVQQNRPRTVHALANFMTGGSSRLVIDLIEHLGHLYEQEVITSHSPNPPCYTGLVVHELTSLQRINEYVREFRPTLLHVHYWGECDKEWYEQVFDVARNYDCKVIENINTPVEPYFSDSIDSYVYVSNYVLEHYGIKDDKSMVIYPGSNFNIFSRRDSPNNIPDNCIGMVYRLETDKLNEQSIDVFIKVAKLRPEIKVLIVGGGSYLETYKSAVSAQGVLKSFTFTGYVSYGDLPRLYEQLSIFVAPVWKESFGQVSPFAMNMGIPVVGYDIGGLAEIVGDKSLLAFPGDSDRLAAIIIDLLDNRDKRLAIGRINRDRAQKLFSVDAMVEGYEELYKKLLESRS